MPLSRVIGSAFFAAPAGWVFTLISEVYLIRCNLQAGHEKNLVEK